MKKRAHHRRYNRYHSRFDQPDPSDGSYDLSNPQSLNRYSYTLNDPVGYTDPSGLVPCWNVDRQMWEDCPDEPADFVINTSMMYWYLFSSGGRSGGLSWLPRPRQVFPRDPVERPERPAPQPEPQQPGPPPCVTSPYMSIGASGGMFLMGGSIAFQFSNRGLYVQYGGGTAISPQVTKNGFRSPIRGGGVKRFGVTPSVRFSRSGITDGASVTHDMGVAAVNVDSQGNKSTEWGFGLPGFSQQVNHTFRLWNYNNCQ